MIIFMLMTFLFGFFNLSFGLLNFRASLSSVVKLDLKYSRVILTEYSYIIKFSFSRSSYRKMFMTFHFNMFRKFKVIAKLPVFNI